jgi:hypothetical protein
VQQKLLQAAHEHQHEIDEHRRHDLVGHLRGLRGKFVVRETRGFAVRFSTETRAFYFYEVSRPSSGLSILFIVYLGHFTLE